MLSVNAQRSHNCALAQVSREIFSKVIGDHPTLPFTLRQYDDVRARLGMKECLEHELFHTYPVLEEKEGEPPPLLLPR